MQKQATEWMRKIDKSGLPGMFKAWIFQHGLLPRLMWPLMLYEVPLTTVEGLERSISSYLRRWFGVPPSFSNIGLYSRTSALQLPLSLVVEEFKVTKARLVMTLRDSKDAKIRQAGIQTRTGRKWSASQSVEQAEGVLKHRYIIGATCSGRQGLGTTHLQMWEGTDDKKKRSMVQGEIRREEEGATKARAVEMRSQGAWTRWKLLERKLTWTDLWRYEPLRIQSLLRSVYDTLPSPANLHQWGLVEEPKCQLCQERGTKSHHILSACKTALTQGRYRWRHDKVLREMAEVLEVERKRKSPPRKHKPSFIRFVKAGDKGTRTTPGITGILGGAETCEMRVDLGEKLVFPDVVQTTLRPDVVIWSAESRQIWEERCDQANERKRAKYVDLMEQCMERGWCTWLFPVEVGCRGFPARSVWKMFQALGVVGRTRKMVVRRLAEAAERASCWLWSRREEKDWKPSIDRQ
ncbi:uncharacterized protein LOC132547205 [Ylistrum balloti]|uniref:uncharacterized protein LOC132547205 n=1 Tax=Ylistrum balloti TaxID=509963 RepID=UPI00290598C0|nr:uncharacterized protein LOC132547205 [Ylistrum balloti]